MKQWKGRRIEMTILQEIIDHRMIGIIRGYGTEDTVKIVKTLERNDFSVIEATLNSPDAKNTLRALNEEFGDRILLGAGTVLTIEDAKECIDIGAKFLLAPVYSHEILQLCREENVLYIPGCYTPTEIYNAYSHGAELIKVFPAGGLKESYIKDVLAPLDMLNLLPTGGVNHQNINRFLKAGAKAVGLGSSLVRTNQTVNKEFLDDLASRVKLFKEELDQYED
jgi:2-dehydro-3-deoxyphosphogluconate aldolase / (4S)-4-hydroxy-2-oxoglutarate aldolase